MLWFKRFISSILVISLINFNNVYGMPGRDPALDALEERTKAGWEKVKFLQDRIFDVTDARLKDKVPTSVARDMAEISGPFMERYVITQDMARTILSIDEVGDILRENDKGTSPVKGLGGVFFKTDGRHFNPDKPMLSPALENAAYWFYYIMFGEGVTPTSLITVNNVLIKRPTLSLLQKFETLFKSYQIARDNRRSFQYFIQESLKKGISQETLNQFKDSFEDSYESFIIQASLGSGDKGLDEFIEDMIKNPRKFNELNKKNLSIHFLASMLLNLSDAKGDNFRVDNGAIIGIDNDRFFAPDIFRECPHNDNEHPPYVLCKSAIHRVGARNIFYCWKDVLNMSIDDSVKSTVISINPFISLSEWLYQLHFYDNEVAKLRDNKVLGKEWFEIPDLQGMDRGTFLMIKANLVHHSAVFPVSLPERSIISLLQKLDGLGNILRFSKNVNHKAILDSMQPHIADFYNQIMVNNAKFNCYEVMGEVYGGKSYEDLGLKKCLKDNVMNDISSPRNTATSILLLEQVIKQIHLNKYPIKEQISIINALGKIYPNVKISKEVFNESWLTDKLHLKLTEQGISIEGLNMLIAIGHEITQTDENNQNLVHKAVLSSKVDLDNAFVVLLSLTLIRVKGLVMAGLDFAVFTTFIIQLLCYSTVAFFGILIFNTPNSLLCNSSTFAYE